MIVFDRLEENMERGENFGYQHFPSSTHSFCGICRRQCHYEFNTVFRKSCNIFCAKPKEVDPIKVNFSMTNTCFDTTQNIINNGISK